jgi:hypothetical protein
MHALSYRLDACPANRYIKPMNETAEPPPKDLPPAAQRALAEAEDRRKANDRKQAELAAKRETNGRGGLDPVRYDDWEVKGIASDFS